MRFLSVCSGIEAEKQCAKCGESKPLSEFHLQPSGKHGRFTYCKPCANAYAREHRRPPRHPEKRRHANFMRRYGLSCAEVLAMLDAQRGKCAICNEVPVKPCVDHDHATGKVRGILCHPCNLALHYIEDVEFRERSMAYLARFA